jgi:hypothetical protein
MFELQSIFRANFMRGVAMLLGSNFNFDLISLLLRGNTDVIRFFAPAVLAWMFVGYVTGTISKGLRNGFNSSVLVFVVVVLIWILLYILVGEDLMSLFQGNQLLSTIGGLSSALLATLIGGVAGGIVSGPEEVV